MSETLSLKIDGERFFTRGGGLCSRNGCSRYASVKIRWDGYRIGDYTCGVCAHGLRTWAVATNR